MHKCSNQVIVLALSKQLTVPTHRRRRIILKLGMLLPCLYTKQGINESIVWSVRRQSIQRSDDMCDFIPVDPRSAPVIHVWHLEHRVHSWISGSSFTEDDLSHPPVVIELLCTLLCCLDDHPVTSFNAEESWRAYPFEWTDSCCFVFNAHQYTWTAEQVLRQANQLVKCLSLMPVRVTNRVTTRSICHINNYASIAESYCSNWLESWESFSANMGSAACVSDDGSLGSGKWTVRRSRSLWEDSIRLKKEARHRASLCAGRHGWSWSWLQCLAIANTPTKALGSTA